MDTERLTEELALNLHDDIWFYLKNNLFESIVDTEDEAYQGNPIVLEKFVSHFGLFYCEFDQRLRSNIPESREIFEKDLQLCISRFIDSRPAHCYIRVIEMDIRDEAAHKISIKVNFGANSGLF